MMSDHECFAFVTVVVAVVLVLLYMISQFAANDRRIKYLECLKAKNETHECLPLIDREVSRDNRANLP